MPPPVAQQIITSMKIIMGRDGTDEGKLHYDIISPDKVSVVRYQTVLRLRHL